jgi:hypothetical protein
VDDDTTYSAGAGLNLNSTTFSVNTSTIQTRVDSNCAIGSSIRAINADGSVTCDALTTFYQPLMQPMTLDLSLVSSDLEGFYGGFTDGRYGYFVPNYGGSVLRGKVARIDLQNFATGGVATLDLATIDSGLKGFAGGFTDGRYGYFVPWENGSRSGKVGRVDLQNFAPSGVITLDLAAVDSGLKGFDGGFTDGRYGYFVPFDNGSPSGKVARVDLQNFAPSGVVTLDLTTVDSGLKGFYGGFTDGRYGYFAPTNNGSPSGKVARVDLQDFAPSGVVTLDLATVDSGLKGFSGGFTDGRYGYFVPSYNGSDLSGKVARVDLQNFAPSGVATLDLTAVDSGLKGFYGGFTDGHYGYFVPSGNGKVGRVDLHNFTISGIATIDLALTDAGLKGFIGGFTDGRYAYFVPQGTYSDSGKVARILLSAGNGAP